MEAAFVNTVHPGDVVVVAVNGLFGQRMCDVAARCGAEVVAVEHEWGTPVDVDRVVAAHPSPAIIAAVHAETSTGVRSDIAALGAAKGDALLVTDAVTSIGGIELRADDWGIDVGYAGTQKCLGVAPGLAPFTINDRAFERRVDRPQSWYLDLGLLGGYVGEAQAKGGGRTYHHTAPVAMVASLHGGLTRILEEGLEAVWARHEAAGATLQEGLQKMGLELFAAEGYRLPELTTVRVPAGRRLRRRTPVPAGAPRHRDRRRRGRVRRHRVADRADGPERHPHRRAAGARGARRRARQRVRLLGPHLPRNGGPCQVGWQALSFPTFQCLFVPGEEPRVVPEEPDPEGVQVLRLVDHAAARAGHHLHRRAERLRQVQRRRRARLGDGRAGRQVPARRQDGRRHLRRHLRPPAAGPRRGRC